MLQIVFQVNELVLMLIKTDKMIGVLCKTTLYVNLLSKTIGGGGGGGWLKKGNRESIFLSLCVSLLGRLCFSYLGFCLLICFP